MNAGTRAAAAVAVPAWALTLHAVVNAGLLRRPPTSAPVAERLSVLIPARDEAARIGPVLRAVLDSTDVPDLEVAVLDDESRDGTADVIRAVAATHDRGGVVRLVTGRPLADGWLGKPHACDQLARLATGSVLVFLDADVLLAPEGLARAVGQLRSTDLDLVSPYPRQVAGSPLEVLIQPLLQWSWLTFLPLRFAERSSRPSLAAANGQLLVVDAAAYRQAGGHRAVRAEVIEDIALLRAVKRAGGRGGVTDGTDLARCRMYDGSHELLAGYRKSLWAAFGGDVAATGVVATLLLLYVVPWLGLRSNRWWAVPALAGPAGRWIAARRTGGSSAAAAVHPVSVLVFAGMVADSLVARRRGALRWRGRPIPS